MNGKKLSILIVLLLLADQLLKIWIKTHLALGEAIIVFPDWFQLRFVENPGFAFGMELGKDWGKLFLSLFRIVMAGGIAWYLWYLIRQKAPAGVIVGFALIFAGAVGNIIDSAVYGLIFSESTPYSVTEFGGNYAGLMHGRVVDMFYFPLFEYKLPWMEYPRVFFGAVFNFADACVTCGAAYLLLFHYKFFAQEEEKEDAAK